MDRTVDGVPQVKRFPLRRVEQGSGEGRSRSTTDALQKNCAAHHAAQFRAGLPARRSARPSRYRGSFCLIARSWSTSTGALEEPWLSPCMRVTEPARHHSRRIRRAERVDAYRRRRSRVWFWTPTGPHHPYPSTALRTAHFSTTDRIPRGPCWIRSSKVWKEALQTVCRRTARPYPRHRGRTRLKTRPPPPLTAF